MSLGSIAGRIAGIVPTSQHCAKQPAMLAGPGRAALAGGAHGPRGGGRAAGAGGLRPFGGSFPAGGHGGLGGPRWLSTKSIASLLERPGSESGAGPGLESPSDSESDSESSEAREAAAAEATAGVGAPARLLTLAGARGLPWACRGAAVSAGATGGAAVGSALQSGDRRLCGPAGAAGGAGAAGRDRGGQCCHSASPRSVRYRESPP